MGKYAFYIYASYGFAIFVLGGLAWQSLRALNHYRRILQDYENDGKEK